MKLSSEEKEFHVKQETLVHAPKLWAEKISKKALIIVSINKRWLSMSSEVPLFKTARKYINKRNG